MHYVTRDGYGRTMQDIDRIESEVRCSVQLSYGRDVQTILQSRALLKRRCATFRPEAPLL